MSPTKQVSTQAVAQRGKQATNKRKPSGGALAGRTRGGPGRARPVGRGDERPVFGGRTEEQRLASERLQALLGSITNRDEYLLAVGQVAGLAALTAMGDASLVRLLEMRAAELGLPQDVVGQTRPTFRAVIKSMAEESGEPHVDDPASQEAQRRGVSAGQVRLERDPVETQRLHDELSAEALPETETLRRARTARIESLDRLRMDQREAAIRQMPMDEFYARRAASGEPGVGGQSLDWLPETPVPEVAALALHAEAVAAVPMRRALTDGLKARWETEHAEEPGVPRWVRGDRQMQWVRQAEMGREGTDALVKAQAVRDALPDEALTGRDPQMVGVGNDIVQSAARDMAAHPDLQPRDAVDLQVGRLVILEAAGEITSGQRSRLAVLERMQAEVALGAPTAAGPIVSEKDVPAPAERQSDDWRKGARVNVQMAPGQTRRHVLAADHEAVLEQLELARTAGSETLVRSLENLAVLQVRADEGGVPLSAKVAESLLKPWDETRQAARAASWLGQDASFVRGDEGQHQRHVSAAVETMAEAEANVRTHGGERSRGDPLRDGLDVDAVARLAFADRLQADRQVRGGTPGLLKTDLTGESAMYAERQFTDIQGREAPAPETSKARELFEEARQALHGVKRGERDDPEWRADANQWLAAVAYDAVRHHSPDLTLAQLVEHQLADAARGERQLGDRSTGASFAFVNARARELGLDETPPMATLVETGPASGKAVDVHGLAYERIIEDIAMVSISSASPTTLAAADRTAQLVSEGLMATDVPLRLAVQARSQGQALTDEQRYLIARQETDVHEGWMVAVESPQLAGKGVMQEVERWRSSPAWALDDLRMRDRFGIATDQERQVVEGADAYRDWAKAKRDERNDDVREVVQDLAGSWRGVSPERSEAYQLMARDRLDALNDVERRQLETLQGAGGKELDQAFSQFWKSAGQAGLTEEQRETLAQGAPRLDAETALEVGRRHATMAIRFPGMEGEAFDNPAARHEAALANRNAELASEAVFLGRSATQAAQDVDAHWRSAEGRIEGLHMRETTGVAGPVELLMLEGVQRHESLREPRETQRIAETREALNHLRDDVKGVTRVLDGDHGELYGLMALEQYGALQGDEARELGALRGLPENQRPAGWFAEQWANALKSAAKEAPDDVRKLRAPGRDDPETALTAGEAFAVARLSLGREATWAVEGGDAATFRLLALEEGDALRTDEASALRTARSVVGFEQVAERFETARGDAESLIGHAATQAAAIAHGTAHDPAATMRQAMQEMRGASDENAPRLDGEQWKSLQGWIAARATNDPVGSWEVVREDMVRLSVAEAERSLGQDRQVSGTAGYVLSLHLTGKDGEELVDAETWERLATGHAERTGREHDALHPEGALGLKGDLATEYRANVIELAREFPGLSLAASERREQRRLIDGLSWEMPATGWPLGEDHRYEASVLGALVPTGDDLVTLAVGESPGRALLADDQIARAWALQVSQSALDGVSLANRSEPELAALEAYRSDTFQRVQAAADPLGLTAPSLADVQRSQLEDAAAMAEVGIRLPAWASVVAMDGFAPLLPSVAVGGTADVGLAPERRRIQEALADHVVVVAEARTGLSVLDDGDYRTRALEAIRAAPLATPEAVDRAVVDRALGALPSERTGGHVRGLTESALDGGEPGAVVDLPSATRALLGSHSVDHDVPALAEAVRQEVVRSAIAEMSDDDRTELRRALTHSDRQLAHQVASPDEPLQRPPGHAVERIERDDGPDERRVSVTGTTVVLDMAEQAADLLQVHRNMTAQDALLSVMGIVNVDADGCGPRPFTGDVSMNHEMMGMTRALDAARTIGMDGQAFRKLLDDMNMEFAKQEDDLYHRSYDRKGLAGALVQRHIDDTPGLAGDVDGVRAIHAAMAGAVSGPTNEALSLSATGEVGHMGLAVALPGAPEDASLRVAYFGNPGRGSELMSYLDALGDHAATHAGTTELTASGIRAELRAELSLREPAVNDGTALILSDRFETLDEQKRLAEFTSRADAERTETLRELALRRDVMEPSPLVIAAMEASASRYVTELPPGETREETLNRAILDGRLPVVTVADVQAGSQRLQGEFNERMAVFLTAGTPDLVLDGERVAALREQDQAHERDRQTDPKLGPSEYERLLLNATLVQPGSIVPMAPQGSDMEHAQSVANYGLQISRTGLTPEAFLSLGVDERLRTLAETDERERAAARERQVELAGLRMGLSLDPETQTALSSRQSESLLENALRSPMEQERAEVALLAIRLAQDEARSDPARPVSEMVSQAQTTLVVQTLTGAEVGQPISDRVLVVAEQEFSGDLGSRIVAEREASDAERVRQTQSSMVGGLVGQERTWLEASGRLTDPTVRDEYLRLVEGGAREVVEDGGALSLLAAQRRAAEGLSDRGGASLAEGDWHLLKRPGLEGVATDLLRQDGLSEADRERLGQMQRERVVGKIDGLERAEGQLDWLREAAGDRASEGTTTPGWAGVLTTATEISQAREGVVETERALQAMTFLAERGVLDKDDLAVLTRVNVVRTEWSSEIGETRLNADDPTGQFLRDVEARLGVLAVHAPQATAFELADVARGEVAREQLGAQASFAFEAMPADQRAMLERSWERPLEEQDERINGARDYLDRVSVVGSQEPTADMATINARLVDESLEALRTGQPSAGDRYVLERGFAWDALNAAALADEGVEAFRRTVLLPAPDDPELRAGVELTGKQEALRDQLNGARILADAPARSLAVLLTDGLNELGPDGQPLHSSRAAFAQALSERFNEEKPGGETVSAGSVSLWSRSADTLLSSIAMTAAVETSVEAPRMANPVTDVASAHSLGLAVIQEPPAIQSPEALVGGREVQTTRMTDVTQMADEWPTMTAAVNQPNPSLAVENLSPMPSETSILARNEADDTRTVDGPPKMTAVISTVAPENLHATLPETAVLVGNDVASTDFNAALLAFENVGVPMSGVTPSDVGYVHGERNREERLTQALRGALGNVRLSEPIVTIPVDPKTGDLTLVMGKSNVVVSSRANEDEMSVTRHVIEPNALHERVADVGIEL